MPELPEVENIRKQLHNELQGARLSDLSVQDNRLLQNCDEEELQKKLIGERLDSVTRRGKYLLFRFSEWTAINHLRMSGRWLLDEGDRTRLSFQFQKEEEMKELHLDDLRRFATLHLEKRGAESNSKPLANLGPEPLGDQFAEKQFRNLLETDREIKRLLLDQKRISGLGNIYVSEILHKSGIHPFRPASRLSDREISRLYQAIPDVLEQALKYEGTSFDSLYRDPSGKPGNFQHQLRVYGREEESCNTCGTDILREKQGQRSSYFCPSCQPAPDR